MENNNKITRELYELYLELGHEVFEEEIKKPMELYYLNNTHDSSNVISMSSLNTFDTNDMQSHKLGDAIFYEDDLFNRSSFDEEIYFDDILPPIYDDYCDNSYAINNKYLQVHHDKNDSCDSYFVEFAPTITNEKDFAYVESNKFLCLWIMIRTFYVILILLSLFMIPLKNIMRGEHMLIDISIISSSLSLC